MWSLLSWAFPRMVSDPCSRPAPCFPHHGLACQAACCAAETAPNVLCALLLVRGCEASQTPGHHDTGNQVSEDADARGAREERRDGQRCPYQAAANSSQCSICGSSADHVLVHNAGSFETTSFHCENGVCDGKVSSHPSELGLVFQWSPLTFAP